MHDQDDIRELLRGKPHLVPLFHSTHNIPERLQEYDPNLFVAYNSKTNQFEIHARDGRGDSLQAVLPYNRLDARTLRYVWEHDIKVHGRDIFRRLDENEDRMKRQKDAEYRDWVRGVAEETQSMFAKDAWAFGT